MTRPAAGPPARVAIVLPPRERFAADGAGAIALLVRGLAAAPGAFQTVVVGAPQPHPFPGVPFAPAHPPWWPGPHVSRYAAAVARVLRGLRPALIEVHNRPRLARALVRLGPPVVLFLHNDPQGMRGCRRPAERAWLGRHLAGIVCVSSWVHGRLGLPGAHVLPNGIDLATVPAAAERGQQQRERLILFAGRLVADKGADAFVEACARLLPALPGWRAAMVGADRFGPDSPETAFLRRLRPRAAAAGIPLLGWRPHREVLDAMARAAIVVVPSRWPEPFGMSALEALACGAAVAYAPRGGLPEVVGQAALAIDPDDPAGMAAALAALAADPQRRDRLARAGRAQAAAFGLPRTAARLDALRADTLAAWPRPPGLPI